MIIFNEQKFKLKVCSMGDGGGDGGGMSAEDSAAMALAGASASDIEAMGGDPTATGHPGTIGMEISAEEPAAVKGKGALSTVGKGALTGLAAGGLPGAILGAVIGLGVSAARGDFGSLSGAAPAEAPGAMGAGEFGPGGPQPARGDINLMPKEIVTPDTTATGGGKTTTPTEDISQTPGAAAGAAEEELRRRRRARFGYWQTRTGAGADMASMMWSPTLYPTVAA